MNARFEKIPDYIEPTLIQSAPLISFPQNEKTSSNLKDSHVTTIAMLSPLSSELLKIETIPFSEDIFSLNKTICSYIYKMLSLTQSPFPHAVIKEIVDNFVHANYQYPSILICNEGYTLIFSDKGCGINEPEKALRGGFYTEAPEKKKYIRGMGLGFTLAKSLLEQCSGSIHIEKNMDRGCVITLKIPKEKENSLLITKKQTETSEKNNDNSTSYNYYLSKRQREVLTVVARTKEAGPSVVSKLLGIALSTAYRDLTYLEQCNFIYSSKGKRLLTPEGISYLTRFKKGE